MPKNAKAGKRTEIGASTAKSQSNSAKTMTKKSAAQRQRRRFFHGIPLKRKVVWVYDTDSPEFKSARKREIEAIRNTPPDPEIEAFLEANLADIAAEKFWR